MLDTLATLAGMQYQIHHGDCRDVMASLDAESVDAIVSDPPYGLSLLGNGWDHGVPGVEFWTKALRVAKTGAHLLAFGGTRTYHRLACAIEDAGWEIRDCVMWVYGSGFPKSHNLKGEWQGWGTALKPAWEPIIVARKPLCDTVAENVLRHGTGAINVDGCRVEGSKPETTRGRGGRNGRYSPIAAQGRILDDGRGRWPANVIHDGSDEVVSLFPQTKTGGQVPDRAVARNTAFLCGLNGQFPHAFAGDSGSAARFFYCAKASHEDRDEGCEGLGDKTAGVWDGEENDLTAGKKRVLPAKNHHPTVKPTALMRYLCRLVTPPGGVVLDPFTGSGSTGKAAILEGFRFIGIEREAEYVEIAKARIAAADSVAGPLFAQK